MPVSSRSLPRFPSDQRNVQDRQRPEVPLLGVGIKCMPDWSGKFEDRLTQLLNCYMVSYPVLTAPV